MILYLDASALVKRYVMESGSPAVAEAISSADVVGTSVISRAETVAALAKAVRVKALPHDEAAAAVQLVRADWSKLVRVQATETLIARADVLAWEMGLRGYDAVQLASALTWRDSMEVDVVMGTYDRQLWRAAQSQGLMPFPAQL
ncbi:MAG: type II toxin-antitoxin system VapC family toxin [Chloroflexota bacterium]|nr:MAG: type II toxin-antitoxin system VapC family toxin [Chloroflexota bacterium]